MQVHLDRFHGLSVLQARGMFPSGCLELLPDRLAEIQIGLRAQPELLGCFVVPSAFAERHAGLLPRSCSAAR